MKRKVIILMAFLFLCGCGNKTETEKEIPPLAEGEISVDALKYYFEDIYDSHNDNIVPVSVDYDVDINDYPYIGKITYKDQEVTIVGDFEKKIIYCEEYDAKTQKLKGMSIKINSKDEEVISHVAFLFTLMPSINPTTDNWYNIESALKKTDYENGECRVVGNWCLSRVDETDSIFMYATADFNKETTSNSSSNNNASNNNSSSESKEEPTVTVSQTQALRKAKEYLDVMSFSRKGLIKQLEYEGFSKSDAEYAVNNCGANWNEQAAKKAKEYLDVMSFSRKSLIEQLEYEGFTKKQATYAVNQTGL